MSNVLFSGILIAFRNLLRSKLRTMLTLVVVIVGIALLLFGMGVMRGFHSNIIRTTVAGSTGYVALEGPGYNRNPSAKIYLHDAAQRVRYLRSVRGVSDVYLWIFGHGTAKTAYNTVPIRMQGVLPSVQKEQGSAIVRNIVAGGYLHDGDVGGVMVGTKLAKRLRLKVGDNLVVLVSDSTGDLNQELYTVRGIFQTDSPGLDNGLLQFSLSGARKLLSMPEDSVTRLGLMLEKAPLQEPVFEKVKTKYPSTEVLNWETLSPSAVSFVALEKATLDIVLVFFALLILGLVYNTMAMSVFERRAEYTILLSLGTPPWFIRMQVLVETLILALVGIGLGLLLLTGVAHWIGHIGGIDISGTGGASKFSVGGVLVDPYAEVQLTLGDYVRVGIRMFVLIMLLTLFPILRATRVDLTDRS